MLNWPFVGYDSAASQDFSPFTSNLARSASSFCVRPASSRAQARTCAVMGTVLPAMSPSACGHALRESRSMLLRLADTLCATYTTEGRSNLAGCCAGSGGPRVLRRSVVGFCCHGPLEVHLMVQPAGLWTGPSTCVLKYQCPPNRSHWLSRTPKPSGVDDPFRPTTSHCCDHGLKPTQARPVCSSTAHRTPDVCRPWPP